MIASVVVVMAAAGVVALGCLLVLVWALLTAPVGSEDRTGYHDARTRRPKL